MKRIIMIISYDILEAITVEGKKPFIVSGKKIKTKTYKNPKLTTFYEADKLRKRAEKRYNIRIFMSYIEG